MQTYVKNSKYHKESEIRKICILSTDINFGRTDGRDELTKSSKSVGYNYGKDYLLVIYKQINKTIFVCNIMVHFMCVCVLLQSIKQQKTILLSTHDMEEADIIGDRIAIIQSRILKCYGTSMFLKKIYGRKEN